MQILLERTFSKMRNFKKQDKIRLHRRELFALCLKEEKDSRILFNI